MRYRRRIVLSKIFSKSQHKKNGKSKYFLTVIGILAGIFLLHNPAINLVKRYYQERVIVKKLAEIQKENEALKEKLRKYENDPEYLERAVRGELNVIAPGEIEYRLKTYKKPKNKK